MAVVIGVLTFAAILAVITVSMLVAVAALVEILPPHLARGSGRPEGVSAVRQSRATTSRERARVRCNP